MLLLILFALLAGAGTAVSPCVLPILPIVAAGGVTGGRRRPLGIAVGLALAFTFSAVALVYLIDALGLPDDIQRIVAVVVLAGFGIAILVPPIGDRIEAFVQRIVGAPRMKQGEGFGSGMVLGAGLGLVYFPCAGPILAGVITLSASQTFTLGRLLVVFAYAIGSAAVLYVLLIGGRKLVDRIKPARGAIQMATGVLMIAAAMVVAFNLDSKFEQRIATGLPDWATNPTTGLEESDAVGSRIADVRGASDHGSIVVASASDSDGGSSEPGPKSKLPVLSTQTVPDLTDPGTFFNTPNGDPVSIHQLNAEGKTVLIDFWTYTCINCIRTLPHVEALYERYKDEGLVVIGVHTPEFPFERDTDNVADAVQSNGLTYPVVQDNDYGTWNAFGNQYWPADYLIDTNGNVRYAHFGEGDYDEGEDAVRSLLAEKDSSLGDRAPAVKAETPSKDIQTPETYLGSARADGWISGKIKSGEQDFGDAPGGLAPNDFAYSGSWDVTKEDATAGAGAGIDLDFQARRVFLVLGSPDQDRDVQVLLDGKPITDADAGKDVEDGALTVGPQRLYSLVDLPKAGEHQLSLRFDEGVHGYAFTFG
jgi:cytochrome c biogenesis protein CcdA/thiol-disulfide isomerase/thioredoxin